MLAQSMRTDADVIERTLAGNRAAFETLLERYGRMAYAVALARTGNHEDAEDMVQEAWLQAFQNLPRLREPERFRPWLGSIVRNLSINAAKRQWRERALWETQQITEGDLRKQVEEADALAVLWTQVAGLAPEHREVLTLHYHAGMTTEEISETIGASRESVKKRLQRARAALGEQTLGAALQPNEPEEERRRKRVMAILLMLPLNPPAPHDLPRQHRATLPGSEGGLQALLTIRNAAWLAAALFVVAAAIVLIFVFHGSAAAPTPPAIPAKAIAPPPPQPPPATSVPNPPPAAAKGGKAPLPVSGGKGGPISYSK